MTFFPQKSRSNFQDSKYIHCFTVSLVANYYTVLYLRKACGLLLLHVTGTS